MRRVTALWNVIAWWIERVYTWLMTPIHWTINWVRRKVHS
jgi:hypothetical protein